MMPDLSDPMMARRLCIHGRVQALAQGGAHAVQALIDWARRGPPQARARRVEVTQAAPQRLPPLAQRVSV